MNQKLKQRLLSESSYVGTLGLLLENDVASALKKAEGISKAIASRKTKIKSLVGSLPSGGYRSGLEKLIDGIFKNDDAISKLFDIGDSPSEEETGKLGGGIDQLADQSRGLKSLLYINQQLMAYLAQQILDANLHKGADKEMPLEKIFEDAELLDGAKKEMKKVLKKGVKQAKSKKSKGFFASIADALGFGETQSIPESIEAAGDGIIDAVLELSPMDVFNFAKELQSAGKEAAAEDEQIQQETEQAQEEIEEEAGAEEGTEDTEEGEDDKAEEEEELTGEDADLNEEEVEEADDLADQAEDVLGNLPFGKLELTKLLKAFPELAGKGNKATTQRRAFRKAMNQAAGQQIFEEGKSDSLDTETLRRFRKLAGIK